MEKKTVGIIGVVASTLLCGLPGLAGLCMGAMAILGAVLPDSDIPRDEVALVVGSSAIILGLMTLLILVEIILWNTLEKTTLIADEYSAYGLAAIIFLGAGYCLKEKGHIRITLLLGMLPETVSRIIAFIATAITMSFMGYVWWYLFKMVSATLRYNSTSGTLTNTPLWIPQAIMLIGAACFFIQLLATVFKTWQAITTKEEVL